MNDYFTELIDPFAKDTPKPEEKKRYLRSMPPEREVVMATINLKGSRNPVLLYANLEGITIHLTIEQDGKPEMLIEDY